MSSGGRDGPQKWPRNGRQAGHGGGPQDESAPKGEARATAKAAAPAPTVEGGGAPGSDAARKSAGGAPPGKADAPPGQSAAASLPPTRGGPQEQEYMDQTDLMGHSADMGQPDHALAATLALYLEPGERPVALARPGLRPYLTRSALVLGLTGALLLPLLFLYVPSPRVLLALPCLLAVDLALFENLGELRRLRQRRWVLTSRRVLQLDLGRSPGEADLTAALPLEDIRRVRALGWWKLFVSGAGGSLIEIAYAPGLPRLKARLKENLIAASRGNRDGPDHGADRAGG